MKNHYVITLIDDDTITVIEDQDNENGTRVYLEDLVRIYRSISDTWVILPWHQIKRVEVTRHNG